ncbi:hypothetical protein C8F01DRAFT_1275256 [Mycena amicta]|nr:hypothetical protein C8F01DRAFT_1275256 [Mycena amicta]
MHSLFLLTVLSFTGLAFAADPTTVPDPPSGSTNKVVDVSSSSTEVTWSGAWAPVVQSTCSSSTPVQRSSGASSVRFGTFTMSYNFTGSAVYVSLATNNAIYGITLDGKSTYYGFDFDPATPDNCTFGYSSTGLSEKGTHALVISVGALSSGRKRNFRGGVTSRGLEGTRSSMHLGRLRLRALCESFLARPAWVRRLNGVQDNTVWFLLLLLFGIIWLVWLIWLVKLNGKLHHWQTQRGPAQSPATNFDRIGRSNREWDGSLPMKGLAGCTFSASQTLSLLHPYTVSQFTKRTTQWSAPLLGCRTVTPAPLARRRAPVVEEREFACPRRLLSTNPTPNLATVS